MFVISSTFLKNSNAASDLVLISQGRRLRLAEVSLLPSWGVALGSELRPFYLESRYTLVTLLPCTWTSFTVCRALREPLLSWQLQWPCAPLSPFYSRREGGSDYQSRCRMGTRDGCARLQQISSVSLVVASRRGAHQRNGDSASAQQPRLPGHPSQYT